MRRELGVRRHGVGLSQAGFTLVEILITTALLGLVVTMVYGSLWSTIDGMTRLEARSERQQAARILMEMIERELRSALLAANDPRFFFVGKDAVVGDGMPADELVWVQSAHVKLHPALPESDVSEVAYWLQAEEDQALSLYKREETTLDGDPEGKGRQYLLSSEIIGLDFEYYGDQGWVSEWDSRHGNKLPKVVQVTLFLPPESEDEEVEAVEIRTLVGLPLGGGL